MLRRLIAHRHLVLTLTRRQYQLRYRQSAMGFVWAFVAPVATLVVATIVFGGIAKIDTGNVPYPLFALSAIVPWSFLSGSVTLGVPSVTQALSMVTRFSFPRAVLPLSTIGTAFIDLAISVVVFLAYLLATHTALPVSVFWFPVLFLVEVALVAGIVLLASALNVFARDIRLLVPLGVQLWLMLTPVMYPLSAVPESARALYLLNPMTGLVESFRRVLVYGTDPAVELLVPSLLGAVVLLLLGLWYFGATERRFADVI